MRNITVEFLDALPLEKQKTELVERKGIGHPDSICDGIAEAVSRALCKEYLDRFGTLMHHNTDQVEIVGGLSEPEWGAGRIVKPMYLLLSGRATSEVSGKKINTGEIAIEAAKDYLRKNIKELDVDEHIIIEQKLGQGSADLRHVFGRGGVPKSNDTSFGVSFAPFSLTEKLTYEVEKYINGKMNMPASGTDVKVMGVRHGDDITLTIANAMVSRHINDMKHYKETISEMQDKVKGFVGKITDRDVTVDINTGDNYDAGSVFLTVIGTSAEQGDDGSVGRGNRANGLITPYRPMSMEATAGKNPVNHVGKVYNLLSKHIAADIAKAGAKQAYVRLMSQIGKPIDQPLIASVQLIGDKRLEKKAVEVTDYWLENIAEMTKMCVEGRAETF